MNKFTKLLLLTVAAFTMSGCTDSFWGKVSSYGGSAEVICYSGTALIYKGTSTGKVANSESSDGYYFIDSKDNKLKEVSGNCIVTYETY